VRTPRACAEIGQTIDSTGRTQDEICLALHPAAGSINHVQHVGNSSGSVDGAAAMLLAFGSYAKENGLRPRARVVATALGGIAAATIIERA
jgi:acetyl-CoA C-acetyltransferase